ncbi:MAG: polyketide synthase [Rhodospirillaceae bacterium]|nr:polyketide synthase [Rhodospirillaceae bacterium]
MIADDAEREIIAFLTARLAQLTEQDQAAITTDSVLIDLGLQSIDAVLLCGEIEDRFRIELDPATIFEHDTLGSFSHEIRQRLTD